MSKLDELIAQLCPDGVGFDEVGYLCKTLSPALKIKSNEYLNEGLYPVIDQGQDFIGGYTNEKNVFPTGEYIIFGDHTCVVKYVDFAFAQGADGVKILSANKEKIKSRYLFHCMANIDNLLPPVSRFGGGNRAKKKETVIEKLKTFFERFFGIG